MIMRRTSAMALMAAMVLGVTAGAVHGQTELRYKFKKGEKLNYVMNQNMAMNINAQGQAINSSVKQEMDMIWTVEDVDSSSNATIKQVFQRIKFKMDMPNAMVDYDSKDGKLPEGPIGQALGPMFKALTGAEFTFKMSPAGEVSDVKIPAKFLEAMKNLPGGGGLGNMFSKDGIKQMINQSGLQFPKKAIKKGDTWETTQENKLPFGQMKVKNFYTYTGPVDKDSVKLESISVQPKIAFVPDPNAQFNVTIKQGNTSGTALFNNQTGTLKEVTMTQNMTMDIAVGGNNITQEIQQTVTLKLQKK